MAENTGSQSPKNTLLSFLQSFTSFMVVFFAFILAMRIYELFGSSLDKGVKENFLSFIGTAFFFDLSFFFTVGAYLLVAACLLNFISTKISKILLIVLPSIASVGHLLLIKYFSVALNPLGGDAFHYSFGEIKQTLSAAVSPWMIFCLLLVVALIVGAFVYLPRYVRIKSNIDILLPIICILFLFFSNSHKMVARDFGSEYDNNLVINKSLYFYGAALDQLLTLCNDSDVSLAGRYSDDHIVNDFTFKEPGEFAFMHADSTSDVLSPFLQKSATSPDYVFIIIEGLGRAFSNENAYLQSFTPFLDSLSRHSLYWENCLSTSGRTFGVLPSVFGSLPYGLNGFAELGDKMPSNLSLMRILSANGYKSSFYYGGDSKFDNMNLYMKQQKVDRIYDMSSFNSSYKKLPASSEGFSWGYGDSELYRLYLQDLDKHSDKNPKLNVLLTVSTHNPFLINDQDKYNALFEKRLQELRLDACSVKQYREYKRQYASILYADDALRNFFKSYASKSSFKNTIFVITGDHRMPDIPLSTKIDRYHVPLLVFSPMIKRPSKFSPVVSHLDILPSILAYQKKQYQCKEPSLVTWMGAGLDTVRSFRNRNNYPLIPNKQGTSEFLSGDYMLSDNKVFKLTDNMGLEPVDDNARLDKLRALLCQFVQRNKKMINQKALMPESILKQY